MSKIQLILIGLGVVVLIVILSFVGILPGRKAPAPPAAQLEFWGIEDEEAWEETISKFEEKYPTVTIKYRRMPEESYEETLLNSLAGVKGPDIFVIKNTWIEKHKDKLYPFPQQSLQFSVSDFKKVFVDAAYELITKEGQILGLPLFMDTPVLVYNKDIFNAAGIAQMPRTWETFMEILPQITRKNSAGDIIISGLAMGTVRNVPHFFEIINSLIIQFGDRIIDQQAGEFQIGEGTENALNFYTSFADQGRENYSWSPRLGDALDAFAQEKASAAIALAQDLPRLPAKNPHLNFGVLPLLQPASLNIPTLYGSYLVPVVSKFSGSSAAAWSFLSFAALGDGTVPYLQNAKLAPARRDLIALGAASDSSQIFFRQALIAKTWPVPEDKAVRRIFQEAVEGVGSRSLSPDQAASQILSQLSLLAR